jgi:hypothetical protein
MYETFLVKPTISRLMYLTLIYMIVVFSPITNVIAQTMFIIILLGYLTISIILKRNYKHKKFNLIVTIK